MHLQNTTASVWKRFHFLSTVVQSPTCDLPNRRSHNLAPQLGASKLLVPWGPGTAAMCLAWCMKCIDDHSPRRAVRCWLCILKENLSPNSCRFDKCMIFESVSPLPLPQQVFVLLVLLTIWNGFPGDAVGVQPSSVANLCIFLKVRLLTLRISSSSNFSLDHVWPPNVWQVLGIVPHVSILTTMNLLVTHWVLVVSLTSTVHRDSCYLSQVRTSVGFCEIGKTNPPPCFCQSRLAVQALLQGDEAGFVVWFGILCSTWSAVSRGSIRVSRTGLCGRGKPYGCKDRGPGLKPFF